MNNPPRSDPDGELLSEPLAARLLARASELAVTGKVGPSGPQGLSQLR